MGNGVGDLNIKAECMSLIQSFVIHDNKLYNTGSQVKSNWNKRTDISDRIIYYLEPSFNMDTDLTCEFKLNSIPSNFGLGFSNVSNNVNQKGTYFKLSNQLSIWYDGSSYTNISNQITTNTVFKIRVQNLNTVNWYLDDTFIGSRTMSGGGKNIPCNLRIDDFGDLDLDYFKVL